MIKVTSKAHRWKESKNTLTKKLIFIVFFFNNKKCSSLYVCDVFLLNPKFRRMQSSARSLKFCGARARVAYSVILAQAASRLTFHGSFEVISTKQYSTNFFRSQGFTSQQIIKNNAIFGAWARVACASYLLGHELEKLKTFLFDCFWSLPYIWEKNIHK